MISFGMFASGYNSYLRAFTMKNHIHTMFFLFILGFAFVSLVSGGIHSILSLILKLAAMQIGVCIVFVNFR